MTRTNFQKMAAATVLCCVLSMSIPAAAGTFAPGAGQPGSTAIHVDDPAFVAWASGCELDRGPMDISNPGNGDASYGLPSAAIGKPANAVVSLGDGGSATLTFDAPITNGPGFDFAVFENAFAEVYLEIAFVEVSSDGVNFERFDAISQTPIDVQVGGFGTLDPTNLYNFAGKYKVLYGTPFDLDELTGSAVVDIASITHVRIVDAVGNIDPAYATVDSLGTTVNDPWPTPFVSSGFDLDGVGVINHLHQVPEPSSAVLLLLGLLAAPLIRRK